MMGVGKCLAIGASMGGPAALKEVLPSICKYNNCPILLTQHISMRSIECFRNSLLQCVGDYRVKIGESLDIVEDKTIYLYAGFGHMRVMKKSDTVMINVFENGSVGHSVDALFSSVASVCKDNCTGLVLTGMGLDGLNGAREIKMNGGKVVVQDRESSLVWSMPGVVAENGLADRVLSIDGIKKHFSMKKV